MGMKGRQITGTWEEGRLFKTQIPVKKKLT